MTSDESRMYDLGRQARAAGYQTTACNLRKDNPLRCWWIAGWHDEDMEQAGMVPAASVEMEAA